MKKQIKNSVWHVGVLTCSTLASRGQKKDTAGEQLKALCEKWWGAQVRAYRVLPDDQRIIARCLKNWCEQGIDVIFTIGGIGYSSTDVTPEATKEVIEKQAPGFSEMMRASCARKSLLSWLSRGVSGLREKTLIINLPGNPKTMRENLNALRKMLPLALDIISDHHKEV